MLITHLVYQVLWHRHRVVEFLRQLLVMRIDGFHATSYCPGVRIPRHLPTVVYLTHPRVMTPQDNRAVILIRHLLCFPLKTLRLVLGQYLFHLVKAIVDGPRLVADAHVENSV